MEWVVALAIGVLATLLGVGIVSLVHWLGNILRHLPRSSNVERGSRKGQYVFVAGSVVLLVSFLWFLALANSGTIAKDPRLVNVITPSNPAS